MRTASQPLLTLIAATLVLGCSAKASLSLSTPDGGSGTASARGRVNASRRDGI